MERQICKERVAALAERQGGRVTWAQLRLLGASEGSIQGWVRGRYLIRVLPHVYAVGHAAPGEHADLWAAVLYAGPRAMLSHASAAHQLGLLEYPPRAIHVSTPRPEIRSLPGGVVVVHARRRELWRAGMRRWAIPTTTVPQTVLDLGTTRDGLKLVRHALAVLDYRGELDRESLLAICGSGRRGSRVLRAALRVHDPRLAHTRSELEVRFLALCVRWRLPAPIVNVKVHGEEVDAYWPDQRLVVELDGAANHSSPAQRRRDHARDVKLRAHGIAVARYDWALMTSDAGAMRADLARALSARG